MLDTEDVAENAWVEGFNRAAIAYLISRDYKIGGWFSSEDSKGEIQKHMDTCSVKTIHSVDQDVEEFGVFDSYDSNTHRVASILSASFSCECGEYVQKHISHEGTLADIILGVVR